jgi:hypothetical protein
MPEKLRTIEINFAESTYAAVGTLARRKGVSKGDVLRDAIALYKWMEDKREAGFRFLTESEGVMREFEVLP